MISATDWQRVGRAVEARLRELGMSPTTAATSSGVSIQTWSKVRKGEPGPYRPQNLTGICRTLGWTPDSIDLILEGREPARADTLELVATKPPWDELTPEQRDAVLRLIASFRR